jgi:hypothetical protein
MVSNFMRKQFSTCLLVQEGSFAPEPLKTEVNLHPGCGFFSDQENAVFPAGDFASVFSESGFPLSPTLSLHHNLVVYNSREPANIAIINLHRIGFGIFRRCKVTVGDRIVPICAARRAADCIEVH